MSANTVYLWETGQVSPKEKSRGVLVGLRKLGAREARRFLETAAKDEGAPRARKKGKSPGRRLRGRKRKS